ncbi:hypothetical protein [Roseicitreum antarcticum]|uniref:Uncharacterized protein n=1 Tax=Roseicitreum antarcticum TaxID=564137 RepID=A0A1H3F7L9_9RHOB|nr:hypothetical protein [Roseicitreum antarcticum]SDX86895.1 hypothetical protein SAMN04488238_1339 [Roseicitreum antarcticum]
MMKYIVGLGVLGLAVVGYFVLVPEGRPPASPTANIEAIAIPEPVPPAEPAALGAPDEEAFLEEVAANAREGLPTAVTDTLTLNDAFFLPRMRIMEYVYVTSSSYSRATAIDTRSMIESRAEVICLDGREMFEMGVTLRNSFFDGDGDMFQRVYLLAEDCRAFY